MQFINHDESDSTKVGDIEFQGLKKQGLCFYFGMLTSGNEFKFVFKFRN